MEYDLANLTNLGRRELKVTFVRKRCSSYSMNNLSIIHLLSGIFRLRRPTKRERNFLMQNLYHLPSTLVIKPRLMIWRHQLHWRNSQGHRQFLVLICLVRSQALLLTLLRVSLLISCLSRHNKISPL
ncbi:uncharacterized protein LOC121747300 [Salvia splendens]|uniref:uncharacterized protein LOC121747300 n=1 Tax=Salvia splendens TaxID=180675 RepID=UPI001C2655E5|nr:uncharacterized protein LOC121747300 [Salvia splendens]